MADSSVSQSPVPLVFAEWLQHPGRLVLSLLPAQCTERWGHLQTLGSWNRASARVQMGQARPWDTAVGLTADPAEGWSPGGGLQAVPSCWRQSAAKPAHSGRSPRKRRQDGVNQGPQVRRPSRFLSQILATGGHLMCGEKAPQPSSAVWISLYYTDLRQAMQDSDLILILSPWRTMNP